MVLVLTDDSWPVSSLSATLHPFKYSIACLKHMSATAPVLIAPFSLSPFPPSSELLSSVFQGDQLLSLDVYRPSGLLHRSFTRGWSLPHVASWHWGNHSHAPHLLLTSTLAPSQSFFQALTLLTFSLNNSLLPSHFLYLFFAALLPFFLSNPGSLFLLFCFSLMSRPTAGCHWVDGEKKKGDLSYG